MHGLTPYQLLRSRAARSSRRGWTNSQAIRVNVVDNHALLNASPATHCYAMSSRDNQTTQYITNKRTRSQLQLPTCNIAFTRSPLRDARDALRRANTQQKSGLGHSMLNLDDISGTESDASCDVKAAGVDDRSEHVRDGTSVNDETAVVGSDPDMEDEMHSSQSKDLQHDTADSSIGSSSYLDQKALPKRSRSPAFDEVFDSPSSQARISKDSNAMKKQRLASGKDVRGPLDAFFSRQCSSRTKLDGSRTDAAPSTPLIQSGGMRRVVSDGQGLVLPSSSRAQGTSTALPIPPTPTIKELKAIPTLDLQTMTPSPRKRSTDAGPPQTPGTGLRAVSEGNILRFKRSDSE